jgi:hypothetical protein
LEVTVAITSKDLAVAQKQLSKSKFAIPYSIEAEIEAHRAVKALEDGLAYAQYVLASRFN